MAQFYTKIPVRERDIPEPGEVWADWNGNNEVEILVVDLAYKERCEVVVFERKHTHLARKNMVSLDDFMFDFRRSYKY